MFEMNELIHGDVLETLKQFPDESIPLVFTSPPYNLKASGMKGKKGGKWSPKLAIEGYDKHTDNMPHDLYVHWQRSVLFELMRVLTPNGAIFYNHKKRIQKGVLQDRQDILHGFPVRQEIIWQRSGGMNFNPGYFVPTYEIVYMICKPKFKLAKKANAIGDVWKIHQETRNPHPAPFPVELPLTAIRATEAEFVLDPFMGSGTTAIAALMADRQYVGIEHSAEYINDAEDRIAAYRFQNE